MLLTANFRLNFTNARLPLTRPRTKLYVRLLKNQRSGEVGHKLKMNMIQSAGLALADSSLQQWFNFAWRFKGHIE